MKKQYCVIGCGRFGQSVAIKLTELGCEVMAVDESEDVIQAISEQVTYAVAADATDENTLKTLGVRNFDVAIVTIGSNIQSSILVTLLLKELGVEYVVAKAQNPMHARVLQKIGANRIVFPEKEMGVKIARSLVNSSTIEHIDLSEEMSIEEIQIPKQWVGRTLIDIDMRKVFEISLIGLRRDNEVHINISPMTPLIAEDILILIGQNEDLAKIETMPK